MPSLADALQESPYQSYTYAYPHKTAYRPIDPAISLRDAWRDERRDALFLYLHIPFCEMRCGFCNLFTTVHPQGDMVTAYLDQLATHMQRTADALDDATFSRLAIGGGTPTYLSAAELERLFAQVQATFDVAYDRLPTSIETSPLTATRDRICVLRDYQVDRISIGVQSFIEAEVQASGRAQRTADVHNALGTIRAVGVPTLNIDLIYGLPGQTVATWLESLHAALRYSPEELYLYPLYVRPLTGLDKLEARYDERDDIRLQCYRAARDLLLDAGYTQVSMRMFRAAHAPQQTGPVYCCQSDGMVGLGCGARSYTRQYHYSSEYAVTRQPILSIIKQYIDAPAQHFDAIHYGFYLNDDDQRRRYILKSILHDDGLNLRAYRQHFGSDALADYPALDALFPLGLARWTDDVIQLTPYGLERSDTIGPWFYSAHVQALMQDYALR